MNRNITATILIVLAIGIYFTVTENVINAAESVQTVNKSYVTALDSAAQLIKVRDQVEQAYNNISAADRTRLDEMIPDSVDNIRLVIDLNSVAMNHGLTLSNVTAAASADATQAASPSSGSSGLAISTPVLDTVTVSFSVKAPYLDFIGFMQDVEADLRITDVTSLHMVSNDNGIYDFSVKLQTYWLRQ